MQNFKILGLFEVEMGPKIRLFYAVFKLGILCNDRKYWKKSFGS